jgi:hypothetical protein
LAEPVGGAIVFSKLPGIWQMPIEMTAKSSHASPILVRGAADAIGSIGRNLTRMLLFGFARLPDGYGHHRRHHGVETFVNMSQMTVAQMSITEHR